MSTNNRQHECFLEYDAASVAITNRLRTITKLRRDGASADPTTIYGGTSIRPNESAVHHWRFRVAKHNSTVYIGIDEEKAVNTDSFFFKSKRSISYALSSSGTTYNQGKREGEVDNETKDPLENGTHGAYLEMTVDCKAKTISFSSNGRTGAKFVIEAENAVYRMCVCLWSEAQSISLESYERSETIDGAVNSTVSEPQMSSEKSKTIHTIKTEDVVIVCNDDKTESTDKMRSLERKQHHLQSQIEAKDEEISKLEEEKQDLVQELKAIRQRMISELQQRMAAIADADSTSCSPSVGAKNKLASISPTRGSRQSPILVDSDTESDEDDSDEDDDIPVARKLLVCNSSNSNKKSMPSLEAQPSQKITTGNSNNNNHNHSQSNSKQCVSGATATDRRPLIFQRNGQSLKFYIPGRGFSDRRKLEASIADNGGTIKTSSTVDLNFVVVSNRRFQQVKISRNQQMQKAYNREVPFITESYIADCIQEKKQMDWKTYQCVVVDAEAVETTYAKPENDASSNLRKRHIHCENSATKKRKIHSLQT